MCIPFPIFLSISLFGFRLDVGTHFSKLFRQLRMRHPTFRERPSTIVRLRTHIHPLPARFEQRQPNLPAPISPRSRAHVIRAPFTNRFPTRSYTLGTNASTALPFAPITRTRGPTHTHGHHLHRHARCPTIITFTTPPHTHRTYHFHTTSTRIRTRTLPPCTTGGSSTPVGALTSPVAPHHSHTHTDTRTQVVCPRGRPALLGAPPGARRWVGVEDRQGRRAVAPRPPPITPPSTFSLLSLHGHADRHSNNRHNHDTHTHTSREVGRPTGRAGTGRALNDTNRDAATHTPTEQGQGDEPQIRRAA